MSDCVSDNDDDVPWWYVADTGEALSDIHLKRAYFISFFTLTRHNIRGIRHP